MALSGQTELGQAFAPSMKADATLASPSPWAKARLGAPKSAMVAIAMEMLRVPADDHSRLCFDANDYRMLRIEELRLSAMTAADKVKRTGVPFTTAAGKGRVCTATLAALPDHLNL